jgi:hypothetical protein
MSVDGKVGVEASALVFIGAAFVHGVIGLTTKVGDLAEHLFESEIVVGAPQSCGM